MMRVGVIRACLCLALLYLSEEAASGLDSRKGLTQYSRATWTRQQGLPQDTIRAIAQTADGYLWLGTDEGLAKFDGYEFELFGKDHGGLPTNAVTALTAASDGSLWIGTTSGLARYYQGRFQIYTTKEGLPDDSIRNIYVDHAGVIWVISGVDLVSMDQGKISVFKAGKDIPVTAVRAMVEDRHHTLWVAGVDALAKREGDQFVPALNSAAFHGDFITSLIADHQDNLWIGGSLGLTMRSASGKTRRFDMRDGLPDIIVRTLMMDHDGNVWAGTGSGLARMESNHLTALPGLEGSDRVRCLFEDHEGNLWMGTNNGLSRLRDDIFTVYGKTEGLPSDDPISVFQDHTGQIWVGFHDGGLVRFSTAGSKLFTTIDGLPSNEVFSIDESRNGDLLVSTRGGLVRIHEGKLAVYKPPERYGRPFVFDTWEDKAGKLWLGLPNAVGQLHENDLRIMELPGASSRNGDVVALTEGSDGAMWAGTYGKGLWRIFHEDRRLFTMNDGLSTLQIRSLRRDRDGTLWIATFGGGLNAYKDGKFVHFTAKDGLLSDNITDVIDDGESLWLSTTLGICRISKSQLRDFNQHKISILKPINYGLEDGLRSVQGTPGYPITGGGCRTKDGRLWFPTSRGLAVVDPRARREPSPPAPVQIVEVSADDRILNPSYAGKLSPGTDRIQIRYAALHLSAPERIQYAHKLEGLDRDWVQAGPQRVINYNSLRHGKYRFVVRARLPEGQVTERSYDFEVAPAFYETVWFRLLSLMALAMAASIAYQLRLRQLRYRFALVLNERTRLAREIHDTVAQDLVGISSQLDALETCLPNEARPAHVYLDLARRMAQHSLTEARRSVRDLRTAALDKQSLLDALRTGARGWVVNSGVDVEIDLSNEVPKLPQEVEQHILRIAQEAVTNALKHAEAKKIALSLRIHAGYLKLTVADDGCGFEQEDAFASMGGHFGLIGMRERAECVGGELCLHSEPGEGTSVEVTVPLP